MTTFRLVGSNVIHVRECEDRPVWLRRHEARVKANLPATLRRQLEQQRAEQQPLRVVKGGKAA